MKTKFAYILALALMVVVLPYATEAQRMSHGARGGGARSAPSMSRPSQPRTTSPQARPSSQPNRSINGGQQKSSDRNLSTKPSTRDAQPTKKDIQAGSRDVSTANRDINKSNIKETKPATRDGKTTVNRGGNNVNINVDKSRTVNVARRGPTYVRPPVRPYPRPPYVYGGFRFYCYHPYHYHPYRPYYWGPVWYPWGFFVTSITLTAIIVTVENQKYYYDQGNYYVESKDGYTVVQAPEGAVVQVLPEGTATVVINETTNNYYYAGTYYEKTEDGYAVVPPTAGTLVENLPEGGEEIKAGDITYVKIGDTYYQPVSVDGKDMYEVVNVEDADSE